MSNIQKDIADMYWEKSEMYREFLKEIQKNSSVGTYKKHFTFQKDDPKYSCDDLHRFGSFLEHKGYKVEIYCGKRKNNLWLSWY